MNLFSSSLINKIKLLGFILVFLMLFILFIVFKTSNLHTKKAYVHHAIKISKLLTAQPQELHKYLQANNLERIQAANAIKHKKNSEIFLTDILIREVFTQYGISLYQNKKNILISIKYQDKQAYFISKSSFFSATIVPVIVSAILFFMIILGIYYYIKSAFSPLVRLEKHIDSFSKAKDVDIVYEDAHDEIANIANAFYAAVLHNKKLKLHKDMYICMVMREISTPLTKAKFITHFMQNSDEKEKLNALFDSMQDELDKVYEFETISSQINKLNMAKHSINALIADVCDVLLLQDRDIFITGVNIEKEFDYNLFIVAVKNLVDNAIKYSLEHKVEINIDHNYIEVKNKTLQNEALNIQKLLEPFEQGNECNSGMGLGLFLIKEIITKHNYQLKYSFYNGYHIFRVNFI